MEQQVNIDLNQTTGITCDECNGVYFEQQIIIRKASGFLTGTGKPSYIPIPVFACTQCGHVNVEFLPKEIKSVDKD
jgi:uncharacterized Zn finger protein